MMRVTLLAAATLAFAACSRPTELASNANGGSEPVAPPPRSQTDTTLPPPPEDAPPPADAKATDVKTDLDAQRDAQYPRYKPKETADTVADYRHGLASDISGLPSDLPSLARAFVDWKGKAAANPGVYEAGAQMLGADEKQYKPSDAELLAAAAGDRLSAALQGVDAAAQTDVNAVLTTPEARAYKRFDFRHVDVMGSGRYFYASPPKDARIPG